MHAGEQALLTVFVLEAFREMHLQQGCLVRQCLQYGYDAGTMQ